MIFKTTFIILTGLISVHIQAQMDEVSLPIKHSGNITKLIYSHDKQYIYTASEDKTIKLWDAKNQELLRTFYGHNDKITVLYVNHENTQLFTGDKSGTVIVWDTKSGKINKTLQLNESITSILMIENKNLLIIGKRNHSITFLNASTLDTLKTIFTSPYYAISMLVSKEKDAVIVGFADTSSTPVKSGQGTIQILDITTFKLFPISTYTESLTDLAFSPDSEKLISASADNYMVRVWDTQRWIEETSIKNPDKPSVVFMSQNNKVLGVGSAENEEVYIYKNTGQHILNFFIDQGNILFGEFNNELTSIQICNHLGMFRKYDMNAVYTETIGSYMQSTQNILYSHYDTISKTIILGYSNGKSRLFNLANEQFYNLSDSFKTAVAGSSCSPNLPLTAIFYQPDVHYNETNGTSIFNSKLILANINENKISKIFSYNLTYVTSAFLSSDYLFTGFNDGTIEVYDVVKNLPVTKFQTSPFDILELNFSEETNMLFIKTIDNKIQVFQYKQPKSFKFIQSILLTDHENMMDISSRQTNTYILTNKRYIDVTTLKTTEFPMYKGKFIAENLVLTIPITQDSIYLWNALNKQIQWKEKLSYSNPVSLFYDKEHRFAGVIYSSGTIQFFGLNNGNSLGTLFLNDNNTWLYTNSDYFDASKILLPHVLNVNGFNMNHNNLDILKQKRKENLLQQLF
jgi:WD40 repeat protein